MIARLCESVIVFILLTFCGMLISKEKCNGLQQGFAYQALRTRHTKPKKPHLHENYNMEPISKLFWIVGAAI